MPLGPVASNEMWDEIYDRLAELVRAASLDAGICEYAAAGGARRASSGRALGRRKCGGAPRQPVAQTASGGREKTERRPSASAGGDGVAGAGNRHRHRGSGRADRFSAGDCGGAAARGPLRATGAARFPKGRFFATTRDELLECAALVRAIRQGELDRLMIPECAAGHAGAADRGAAHRRCNARPRNPPRLDGRKMKCLRWCGALIRIAI